MLRKLFFILVFTFFNTYLFAQNISDKLVRYYLPNSYWLNLRADYYLKSGSYLYFENNSRFMRDATPIANTAPFNKIYRMYFMGGFEYKASDNWYLGFSEKIVLNPGNNSFYTRININHRGKFLGLRFIKEGAFEYLKYPHSDNPNSVVYNEGRLSFSPSLIKDFKIAGRKFFVVASYRAYVLFDFVNDGYSAYNKRFFDKTRLRFELDYFVSNRLLISIFAIRDTDYSYQLAQFTQSSPSSPMVQITPEARVNYVTPTFGFTLNYVFNAPEDFIPGFPIK